MLVARQRDSYIPRVMVQVVMHSDEGGYLNLCDEAVLLLHLVEECTTCRTATTRFAYIHNVWCSLPRSSCGHISANRWPDCEHWCFYWLFEVVDIVLLDLHPRLFWRVMSVARTSTPRS